MNTPDSTKWVSTGYGPKGSPRVAPSTTDPQLATPKVHRLSPVSRPGTSPSDQQAQLIREQWDDYMARFKPKETELMGLAMGNADNQLSETRAIGAANTGFGVANSTLGRMRSRIGQTMTGDETANENRQNSSLQQAAVVTAQNRARFHARDRDNAILTGANLGQGL